MSNAGQMRRSDARSSRSQTLFGNAFAGATLLRAGAWCVLRKENFVRQALRLPFGRDGKRFACPTISRLMCNPSIQGQASLPSASPNRVWEREGVGVLRPPQAWSAFASFILHFALPFVFLVFCCARAQEPSLKPAVLTEVSQAIEEHLPQVAISKLYAFLSTNPPPN